MQQEMQNQEFNIKQDPYNYMLRVLFNRWKPYIIRAISFDQDAGRPTYYSAFFKQLPITQKVLSQNLKELEQDGLIERHVLPENLRVEYHLTEYGSTLLPILNAVYDWGWHDMKKKDIPIDPLGEMWHGYRKQDASRMHQPFKNKQ